MYFSRRAAGELDTGCFIFLVRVMHRHGHSRSTSSKIDENDENNAQVIQDFIEELMQLERDSIASELGGADGHKSKVCGHLTHLESTQYSNQYTEITQFVFAKSLTSN